MWEQSIWRMALAECMCVAIFVFICCGTAVTNGCCDGPGGMIDSSKVVAVSMAFGFTILVLAHSFGHVSGAHINPAVTFGLLCTNRIPPKRAALFFAAQMTGGVLGALVLYGALPEDNKGCLGANTVANGFSVASALFLEIVTTGILVLTVMSTVDVSNSSTKEIGLLPIGMAVFVCHLISIPLTGCGINPARSFGPGIVAYLTRSGCENVMDDHWVFWLGPFVGAAFFSVAYERIIQDNKESRNLKSTMHTSGLKSDMVEEVSLPQFDGDASVQS
mmetsp:Transcript_11676/g.22153  ORF Transcript_11676/g.22153 Transcript_11676/m.22153 type:complete len:276 (+) Transcript_11676:124-951(+)